MVVLGDRILEANLRGHARRQWTLNAAEIERGLKRGEGRLESWNCPETGICSAVAVSMAVFIRMRTRADSRGGLGLFERLEDRG